MAKIPRVFQKIFGSSAGLNQLGVFGSLAAGSPDYATDISDAMSLSNYLGGYFSGVVGNNKPAIEDENTLHWIETTQLAYLFQAGIAEWNASTEYCTESFVQNGGVIFKSLANSNTNNATSDTTKWKTVVSNPFTTLGDLLYSLANGVPQRVGGNIAANMAMLAQTGTGTASAAPFWRQIMPPAFKRYTSTGAATHNMAYVFACTSASATAGATYTNNSVTFTVEDTIAGGTILTARGNSAPSASGTLTKASGTGDATITFQAMMAPLYIEVELVGGGGGGGGSGATGTAGPSTNGGNTTFGSTLLVGNGGNAGINGGQGGGGGTASLGAGVFGYSHTGHQGGGGGYTSTGQTIVPSGYGGSTIFGGGGSDGFPNGTGTDAIANSGGGGGGAQTKDISSNYGGAGGGSGGYAKGVIKNPASTYALSVGAKGTKGTAGTNGFDGGDGADGQVIVREYYQ